MSLSAIENFAATLLESAHGGSLAAKGDTNMNYGRMMMKLGGFGLVLWSGCVALPPDPGPTVAADPAPKGGESVDANVVLRLDVGTDHSVTFYEPTPGGLYLAERMAPGQTFVLHDKEASDALAAFARLRPQADIPEALQAAYDRARNLAPNEPIALAAHASGDGQPEAMQVLAVTSGVIQQALTSSSSAANFVDNDGGCDWGPTWSFCRVNWGGGFFATTTATSGLCTVDHYAGNGVVVQITVNGTIIGSPFQNPGTIVQYSLGSPGPAVTRRIDITNASGDSFHAGCHWG